MTLMENIKIALSLADEYSPEAGYDAMFTEDEDFQNKLKILYAQPYQELSQIKKIRKIKNISRSVSEDAEEHYTAYSLPFDMYILKNVIALDRDTNKPVDGDFYIINNEKKIYINDTDTATYKIEYYAYPEVITEETEYDFDLELEQDAQMILAYKVVDNILKTDPSADYSAFKVAYDEALNRLDLRESTMIVNCKSDYDF